MVKKQQHLDDKILVNMDWNPEDITEEKRLGPFGSLTQRIRNYSSRMNLLMMGYP
jgi:hypothetical protein